MWLTGRRDPGRRGSVLREGAGDRRCCARCLDAPGALHYVIRRGLDHAAFVTHLGAVAVATGTKRYAWALLPNLAHLGTGAFVEQLLAEGDARLQRQNARGTRLGEAAAVVSGVSAGGDQRGGGPEGGRRRRLSDVRARLAVHLVTQLRLSLAEAARHLGVSTSGLAKAVTRAEGE